LGHCNRFLFLNFMKKVYIFILLFLFFQIDSADCQDFRWLDVVNFHINHDYITNNYNNQLMIKYKAFDIYQPYYFNEGELFTIGIGYRIKPNSISDTRWCFKLIDFEISPIPISYEGLGHSCGSTNTYYSSIIIGFKALNFHYDKFSDFENHWIHFKVGIDLNKTGEIYGVGGPVELPHPEVKFRTKLVSDIGLTSIKLGDFNYSGLKEKANDFNFGFEYGLKAYAGLITKDGFSLSANADYRNILAKNNIGILSLGAEFFYQFIPIPYGKDWKGRKNLQIYIKYENEKTNYSGYKNFLNIFSIGVRFADY
jgi:hypothetical protein